jgi:hypothetical protein
MKTLRWGRFIVICIVVIYLNCVLTNCVSLRQRWYVDTYLNGTDFKPLYDTLFIDWIKGYNIPLLETITLRDMVDICTYSWVLITILFWITCHEDPKLMAKVLTAQLLLVPTFSLSQLLTIVPDATPNCLEVYNIPKTRDISWIFWKYPFRACGNMLWSSDITQLIIFTSVATQMVPNRRPRCKWFVWFLGECWTYITVIFIFTAKYQYSVDVLSTIVVVKLAMSHHLLEHFAQYVFLHEGEYYQRAPLQEMVGTI